VDAAGPFRADTLSIGAQCHADEEKNRQSCCKVENRMAVEASRRLRYDRATIRTVPITAAIANGSPP
jgi:hypothetical protein